MTMGYKPFIIWGQGIRIEDSAATYCCEKYIYTISEKLQNKNKKSRDLCDDISSLLEVNTA
jgi:hypothetical protein